MIKKFLKRGMAVALAVSLVTGLTRTGFSPLTPKVAEAAESDIVLGETYSFGGYSWIAAEASGNEVVLQSKGVTSGYWPGYVMNDKSYYDYNIDYRDISSYNTTTQNLYNAIKDAAYGYPRLYLVSNSQAGTTSYGTQGSGYYWQALKEAAAAGNGTAWLGTASTCNCAWEVYSSGKVDCGDQAWSHVVAPAFNLDKSKVTVSYHTINIKYSHSLSYDVATNGGTSAAPETIEEIDPDTVFDDASGVFDKTAEKQGWTFVGWNTNKDAHEGLTSLTMESDKTLYAIFKKDLTVTFIDAGS